MHIKTFEDIVTTVTLTDIKLIVISSFRNTCSSMQFNTVTPIPYLLLVVCIPDIKVDGNCINSGSDDCIEVSPTLLEIYAVNCSSLCKY